ncbi:MAG: ATP-binding protein [Thermoguttaceae bacterium]|nr:ATP-binding protein [Thermoguttaceae bacterium]
MEIKRDIYLNRLIRWKKNGLIKVITGIRRCGKSYLLLKLFHRYLVESGVREDHIIEVELDDLRNEKLRDPYRMLEYVEGRIIDGETYYIVLDEVQFLERFEEVLNSFLHLPNSDIYVTGSNSRFLSSDVITEFRGRGIELRVYPLSFREFSSVYQGKPDDAWNDYYTYGGLPLITAMGSKQEKIEYLSSLFQKVYLSDIIERHKIRHRKELGDLVNVLASSVGSLTSLPKLVKTFKSAERKEISRKTLANYTEYLIDAFLINKAVRYDLKGRKHIGSLAKYYFEDVGLRNARIGFRQVEENHIMENILYNELKIRGYRVDVGIIEKFAKDRNNKTAKKQLEIDFVANLGDEQYYIQSALDVSSAKKRQQEERSLRAVNDGFKKIVVVKENIDLQRNNDGISTIGIRKFLLDELSLLR